MLDSTTTETSSAAIEAVMRTPKAAPSADQMRPLLVNLPEARRILGDIGKTAFYGAVERHGIRLVHLGGRSLVPISEIDRVVAELVAAAAPTAPTEKAKTMAAASVASRRRRGNTS